MNSKFLQLIEKYNASITEETFPPLSNIKPVGTQQTNTTSTPNASADPIETDPNVINAKKKAIQQQEINLKQKANTITRP